MKTNLLPLLLAASLLSSCATYQSGQTPDDVYYSPGRDAIARTDKEEYEESYVKDDNYLRRRVSNRYRWGSIDDFGYWNDPRFDVRFGNWNSWNTMGWNTMGWNSWGWNSWNRPTFGWGLGGNGWGNPLVLVNNFKNPSRGTNTGSSATAYRNRNYNNDNYLVKDAKTGISSTGNNQNAGFGNMVRRVFSSPSSSGSNNSSWDRSARTFSSGSSSSYSGGLSSSAGGTSGGTTNSTATSSSAGGRGGRGN
ncbi:MAG TPA: hypothetical protein DIW54_11175 [Chitinophagaceae bacterium]|nr:hypothetical protein [Chitinophagaceae bacterium]